jgi:hypothetical protein
VSFVAFACTRAFSSVQLLFVGFVSVRLCAVTVPALGGEMLQSLS